MRLFALTPPRRWLAAVLAPVVLAGTAITASAATSAPHRPETPRQQAAHVHLPEAQHPHAAPLRALTLPAQRPSAPVTLITGDTVRLSTTPTGQYTAAAVPGHGRAAPMATISTGTGQGKAKTVYAIPAAAGPLVTAGLLDRGLFDVTWLTRHPASKLRIMLEYPAGANAAAHAAALPGATVMTARPGRGTVEVSVPADRAAAFWAALAGDSARTAGAQLPGQARPALAGGVRRAWLAGHLAPAGAVPTSTPLYTVTETIKRSAGSWVCSGRTFCLLSAYLLGVSGAGADVLYNPVKASCLDASPCTTQQLTFRVPAGVYMADALSYFDVDGLEQWGDLADTQFTVAGDTAIAVNADAAQPLTVSTPLPTAQYTGSWDSYRTTGDGFWAADNFAPNGAYGHLNFWAVPTTQTVSVGSYRFSAGFILGVPPVTMTVHAPQRRQLHPLYADYSATKLTGTPNFLRFTGHKTMPLVDAGYGTAQDFAKVDVHGKLVLLTITPDHGCQPDDQLAAAGAAGAAGVIFDPTDPAQQGDITPGVCPWPLGIHTVPGPVPFVSVSPAEAAGLRGLLGQGPVRIDVTDSGTSPYVYQLQFFSYGRVPASLHYTVTGKQLAAFDVRYHDTVTEPVYSEAIAAPPDGFGIPDMPNYEHLAPLAEREYIGPVSPALVWDRFTDHQQWATTPEHFNAGVFGLIGQGHAGQDWMTRPLAPGDTPVDASVFQAQPGKWQGQSNTTRQCSLCRQGDTFYPLFTLASGANVPAVYGRYVSYPLTMHLYQGTTEIPQTVVDGNVPVFQLPAQRAWYRLSTGYDGTFTDWRFSSASPVKDTEPDGAPCVGSLLGLSAEHCGADPFIFLRYNAHVDMNDAVTAPGTHQLQVTAYYQAAQAPAKVTSLALSVSTDGGATWQPAIVRGTDGNYTVTYSVPGYANTSGTVSIKAAATDSAGDTINQTIYDAFSLTS